MTRFAGALLIAALLLPPPALAQNLADAGVWRQFVAKLDVGTELHVRLRSGQRFTATLVGTAEDVVMLQPKTRIPVDFQRVAYESIASLERRTNGGLGAAKAAAVGVAVGAGAFLAILMIFVAAVDD